MRASKARIFCLWSYYFRYFYKQVEKATSVRTLDRVYIFIKNIFPYSYSEARGFVALLVVSIILLFVIFFPKTIIRNQIEVDPAEVKHLDSLASLFERDEKFELFLFDPNTLPKDSLMFLGFPQRVAGRLVNYRDKGEFHTKDDVKKVYGINEQLVDSLYPYINLPAQLSETNNYSKTQKFNINTASTDQLKKVNMIGDVLAARIVKYRERLGGFIAVN
jgi:competence protein ComEA